MREQVGVRRRVRARRAPDRLLVDLDHLVEDVDSLDARVRTRLDARTVEPVRECLEHDLVHERRLAGARDAGHADELADRELDVDVLEVVLRRAADEERAAVLVPPRGDRDRPLAREELARHRLRDPLDLRRRPFGHDLATVEPGARPHVHEPVGAAHHLLVVLDDDDGVADVPEPSERVDQPRVVALVEPDRRLVEDVEDADELRADLRREPEPLRLAARQRRRRTIQRQIADADVVEEREPLADLLHDPVADQLLGRRQLELVEEPERARHRQLRERVNGTVAHRDREHLRLEARALADRARPQRHVLLDPLALRGRVRLLVAAREARRDAVERQHVLALPPHAVAVLDVDLLAVGAVQEAALLLLGQLGPRLRRVDLVPVGDGLDHGLVEARGSAHRPRHERAVVDRDRRIGDEQVGIDLLLRAEAGAARARAVRRVEGEDPRLQLGQRDAVVGAGEVLGEEQLLAALHEIDRHEPLRKPGRGLDRLREPEPQVGPHHEAVDDDLDRVLVLLVELGHALLEHVLLAVDLDAREPVPRQVLEDVLVLALAVAHDRRVDGEAGSVLELQHLVDDRVEALPRDRLAADRAVRPPDSRVEEAQIVVDLGHGADRRARVARGRLLVDRDRRTEAVDVVDVRLLHHLEELARVGGERLDVAALALRVDRVEGERRLARAGQPGDADEAVPRQADGDVLQVVLAGAVYDKLVGSHVKAILLAERTFVCRLSALLKEASHPSRHAVDLEVAGDDRAVAEEAPEQRALDLEHGSGERDGRAAAA